MKAAFNNTPEVQYPLIREMIQNNLSMVYYGNFSDKVNDTLIPFAESLLGQAEAELMIRKRAFYILVECIQNINRHHAHVKKSDTIPREIFMVRERDKRFDIALGNVLKSENVKRLHSKLSKLNQLSEKAINAYYKNILKENVLTHRGGAGLGLIEVARKSGSKTRFHFEELNKKYSFFSMETRVNNTVAKKEFPEFDGLNDIEKLLKYYRNHHFGLLLKSPFGFYSLSQVVSVINYLNNLDEQHFITDDQMADYLSEVQFFLKELFFIDSNSFSESQVFLFDRIDKKKDFCIIWLSSNKVAGKNYRILQQSLPENTLEKHAGNFGNLAFKEALRRLSQKTSRNINLLKFPFKSDTTLFSLQIPLS